MVPALPAVRRLGRADADWIRGELQRAWGSVYAARKGQAVDASALDGFVASLDCVDVGLVIDSVVDELDQLVGRELGLAAGREREATDGAGAPDRRSLRGGEAKCGSTSSLERRVECARHEGLGLVKRDDRVRIEADRRERRRP